MAFNSALERAIRLRGRDQDYLGANTALTKKLIALKKKRNGPRRKPSGAKRPIAINPATGMAGYIDAPGALSPSQIINRRTSNYWGLAAYPGQRPPTYAERRYGGLGASDSDKYETVMVKVGPQHHPAALAQNKTGLGSWLSNAIKAVGKAAKQVLPIVAVALPIVGSIIPGLGTALGGLLGSAVGGLAAKAKAIAAAVKPALQAGGQAIKDVQSQAQSEKAKAWAMSQDPKLTPEQRAAALQTYQYYQTLDDSLNTAQNTLQGAATGAQIGAKGGQVLSGIQSTLAGLPSWAVPAAIAGVAVLVLNKRR